jgi:chromosomal replication initiator protein
MVETKKKSSRKESEEERVTASSAWAQCLEIIKDNINYQKYKSWFHPIKPVALNQKTLTIQVPSQFWYEWLEEHYYNIMRSTISKVLGEGARFEYSIVLEKADQEHDDRSVRMPQRSAPPMPPGTRSRIQPRATIPPIPPKPFRTLS